MALSVDIELEEERMGGHGGGDIDSRVRGACADALDYAFRGAGPCDGQFAVRVDETGHGGWRDHEGQRYGQAEDGALGRDVCDVAHDAWTEPDAAVQRLVCVASNEAGVGGGVEGPCFGAGRVSGGELKVFGANERFKRWLFRGAIRCGFGTFVCKGLGPFFGDGRGIEDALQGIGGKAFFDDGRGVDGGVRLCGVAAGIFIYDCTV